MGRRLKSFIQIAYLCVVAAALGYVLLKHHTVLLEVLRGADRRLLAASILLCFAAPLIHAYAFMRTQTAVSEHNGAPLWVWLHAFMYSNLGRYVPGKAAVVVGRMLALQPYGHRPASFVASAIVETAFLVLSGCCLSVLLLPALLPPPLGTFQGSMLALIVVLAAVTLLIRSPLFGTGLTRLSLLFKLQEAGTPQRFARNARLQVFAAFTSYLATCGLAYALLIAALSDQDIPALMAVGSYGLGVSAGIAALFAPGGIGVREAIAVAPLQHYVPLATTLVAALALRLLLLIAEVLLACAAFALLRWQHRDNGEVPPGERLKQRS